MKLATIKAKYRHWLRVYWRRRRKKPPWRKRAPGAWRQLVKWRRRRRRKEIALHRQTRIRRARAKYGLIISLGVIAESRFGLTVREQPFWDPVDDVHVSNSWHYKNRAIDVYGPRMHEFAKYVDDHYRSVLLELIYSPLGYSVRNGQKVEPYAVPAHYNHVHVAA